MNGLIIYGSYKLLEHGNTYWHIQLYQYMSFAFSCKLLHGCMTYNHEKLYAPQRVFNLHQVLMWVGRANCSLPWIQFRSPNWIWGFFFSSSISLPDGFKYGLTPIFVSTDKVFWLDMWLGIALSQFRNNFLIFHLISCFLAKILIEALDMGCIKCCISFQYHVHCKLHTLHMQYLLSNNI